MDTIYNLSKMSKKSFLNAALSSLVLSVAPLWMAYANIEWQKSRQMELVRGIWADSRIEHILSSGTEYKYTGETNPLNYNQISTNKSYNPQKPHDGFIQEIREQLSPRAKIYYNANTDKYTALYAGRELECDPTKKNPQGTILCIEK